MILQCLSSQPLFSIDRVTTTVDLKRIYRLLNACLTRIWDACSLGRRFQPLVTHQIILLIITVIHVYKRQFINPIK